MTLEPIKFRLRELPQLSQHFLKKLITIYNLYKLLPLLESVTKRSVSRRLRCFFVVDEKLLNLQNESFEKIPKHLLQRCIHELTLQIDEDAPFNEEFELVINEAAINENIMGIEATIFKNLKH